MRLELLALLLTATAQDNEAEKLFRAMEKKILAAKTLQISLESTFSDRPLKFKGSIAMATENKLRVEGLHEADGKPMQLQLICDGLQTKWVGGGEVKERPGHENLNKGLLASFAPVGLIPGLVVLSEPGRRKGDFDNLYTVSDFKLAGKEMVGKKLCHVVHYKFQVEKGKPAYVRLWIDIDTTLPLKRSATDSDGNVLMAESYSSIRIDEEIDAKLFELAK